MVSRRSFLEALAALPAQKKQRKPDLEIVRIASTRQEGKISYEGTVRVSGEKPIAGLVLQFEFLESRGVLLSQQKIQVEDSTLAPGDERHFLVQGNDVPRAVSFRVAASDASGRDLSVSGVGPYPLD